ncbi:O-antigen ligase family protein [Gryllotalpicola protaetiae]|nr:O-antigen ligase family protein [Gryllotalpicola protaetiae]
MPNRLVFLLGCGPGARASLDAANTSVPFRGSSRGAQIYATLVFLVVLAGDAWRYTISWYGWGALTATLVTIAIFSLVRARAWRQWRIQPVLFVAFLLILFASIAWSQYRIWTFLAAALTLVTYATGYALLLLRRPVQLTRALGDALRIILWASLAFEATVSLFLRRPLAPFWTDYSGLRHIPAAFYWSRDLLLHGGRIQGVVGNSDTLAMIALLGLIVFVTELVSGLTRFTSGSVNIAVALVTLALTRSGTVTVALVATGVVGAFLVIRHAAATRLRAGLYASLGGAVAAVAAVVLLWHAQLLHTLGKSPDLTGRTTIWHSVEGLALERPWLGWGWISYWVPTVKPFKGLAVHGGVEYLQAHNAWLDVWMQLGVAGLALFVALVISTIAQCGRVAFMTEPSLSSPLSRARFLPLLVMTALITQSFAESRLLVEYGMLLLAICALATHRRNREVAGR